MELEKKRLKKTAKLAGKKIPPKKTSRLEKKILETSLLVKIPVVWTVAKIAGKKLDLVKIQLEAQTLKIPLLGKKTRRSQTTRRASR